MFKASWQIFWLSLPKARRRLPRAPELDVGLFNPLAFVRPWGIGYHWPTKSSPKCSDPSTDRCRAGEGKRLPAMRYPPVAVVIFWARGSFLGPRFLTTFNGSGPNGCSFWSLGVRAI